MNMKTVDEMFNDFRSGKPLEPEEINYLISHMQEVAKLCEPLGYVFQPASDYAKSAIHSLTKMKG